MLPVILKREYTRAPSFSIISSMIDYNIIHDRLLPPFWLQVINVNVTLPLCNSVYSFVGFVFFVSLAHTQWSGGLFFEPLSFVLQSSLWWVWVRFFVVLARFCFGSRVKFLAALVVSHFLFSSQLVIFPPSTNSFMFLGMFLSCSQVIIVWLSTAAAMLSNNTNSEFCLKGCKQHLISVVLRQKGCEENKTLCLLLTTLSLWRWTESRRCTRVEDWNNEQGKPSTNVS